ncbi:MAG: thioredoxin domain-containing protein [Planctomycetota bacterium]
MGILPSREEIARLPADGGPEFNRLVHETSPYLLQHARNPVDWHPWGAEAFARARAEDKPVFLSVGYSTCHWCHVMERESFEQRDVARVLNRVCIPIKVDREERPDLDEIYMMATQALTGHGGWPNSVWLTPDGRPWYAGTYFPPEDRGGRVGFVTLLQRLDEVWRQQRERVEESAQQLTERLRDLGTGRLARPGGRLDRSVVGRAVEELEAQFDPVHGGFGGAPKFPPHGSLRLLLAEIAAGRDPEGRLRDILTATLRALARGGIHDQLAGGFHRYSTDTEWLVPHFEKMLYDNAQLGFIYTEAYRLLGDDEFKETAESLFDWVLTDMTSPDGGFYSALDADSEGEEGRCYVWTRAEVEDGLRGKRDEGERETRAVAVPEVDEALLVCMHYGVTEAGNYRDEATHARTGRNILHRARSLDDVSADVGLSVAEVAARLDRARARLLGVRRTRSQPHLDDKILTAWNGLMIGALAHAARVFAQPRYEAAARRAADFVLANLRPEGKLRATYRLGEARLPAYLDDHAFLADGLLDLHELTHDERYSTAARGLAEDLTERFENASEGGFYFTATDHEPLLVRSQDPYDKAIPSGNGVAARVFLRLSARAGDPEYRRVAERTLTRFLPQMRAAPRGTEALILALTGFLEGAERAAAPADRLPALGSADAEAQAGDLVARLYLGSLRGAPGAQIPLCVVLELPAGVAASGTRESGAAFPTELTLDGPEGFALVAREVADLHDAGAPTHRLRLRGQLTVASGIQEGAQVIRLQLATQLCRDDRCELPQSLPLAVPFWVTADAAAMGPWRHPDLFAQG